MARSVFCPHSLALAAIALEISLLLDGRCSLNTRYMEDENEPKRATALVDNAFPREQLQRSSSSSGIASFSQTLYSIIREERDTRAGGGVKMKVGI